jgi:hypothetical protein
MEEQLQDVSSFNMLALVMLVVLACLIWSLPRRYAVCPLLVMVCLMPLGQELVIFGLHLFLFRLLLLVGILRVFVKGETRQLVLVRTDKIFIWWVIVAVIFGTLAKPSMDLFKNRLGEAYNAIFCYFFIRCVIVDFEDIVVNLRTLAWLSLPVALLMLVEKKTTHNLLSIFGGVPEITTVREGHLRCQGAFRHPILAGTFGAAAFPLFVGLWGYRRQGRLVVAASLVASVIIVVTASTSGALMAFVAGLGGLALWKWREHLRLVRWGAVVAILGLALVMKAPVWYLFDRLSSITGGTGWHRAFLIDQTIHHFDEWWLFGTTYTAHWAPAGEVTTADPNMMDITSQYVSEGVSGGLLRLVLFVSLIVGSFKAVGRRLRLETDSATGVLVWATGVCLFTHCVSFMSIPYFDQSKLLYYWLLAVICRLGSTLPESVMQSEPQAATEVLDFQAQELKPWTAP